RSLRQGTGQPGRFAPSERDFLFPRWEQALGQAGSGRPSQDAGSPVGYASHYGGEQTAQFGVQQIGSVSRTEQSPGRKSGFRSKCSRKIWVTGTEVDQPIRLLSCINHETSNSLKVVIRRKVLKFFANLEPCMVVAV